MTASGTTVLLVDDLVESALATKTLLETIGHSVTIAHSASVARKHVVSWRSTNFAIVMLDQMLTDGRGIDLVLEFSRLIPLPAIGVLSGRLDCGLIRKACEAGAIAFPRPRGLEDLVDVIGCLSARSVPKSAFVGSESQLNGHRVFGGFCLRGPSLVTQHGVLELLPKSAALLAYLVDRRTAWASVSEIAMAVFARRPELQGGPQLVYHHNYALKRELGEYAWLVESKRNVGYRLAPSALLSRPDIEQTAADGSQRTLGQSA